MIKRFILSIIILLLSGCTEQQMVRQYGGTETVKLAPGQRLEIVTWKDSDLWILTRAMKEGEEPQVYKFSESSSWGVWEGTIRIVESKKKAPAPTIKKQFHEK